MSHEVFAFHEQYFLTRSLGLSAWNLPSLLRLVEDAPDASIFCHVHMARLRPPAQRRGLLNNFASWVLSGLHETRLAESLSLIDGATSPRLSEIREALATTIRDHMGHVENGPACLQGHEFHLCDVEGDVIPTGVEARTVSDLATALSAATKASFIYHLYSVPLRHEDGEDDISRWLESIGERELAARTRAFPRWALPWTEARKQLTAILEGSR